MLITASKKMDVSEAGVTAPNFSSRREKPQRLRGNNDKRSEGTVSADCAALLEVRFIFCADLKVHELARLDSCKSRK